jgi:hypothetical protein
MNIGKIQNQSPLEIVSSNLFYIKIRSRQSAESIATNIMNQLQQTSGINFGKVQNQTPLESISADLHN